MDNITPATEFKQDHLTAEALVTGPAEIGEPGLGNGKHVSDLPDINTHTIPVTFFKNKSAQSLRAEDLTLQGIAHRIAGQTAADKANLPLLELKTFGTLRTDKNCLRHDANVINIGGIEGDADDMRLSFADAVARVKQAGIRALVYTSPSWVLGVKEKWRVLFPLSHTYLPERRTEFVAWANGLLDGAFSGETFTLSQAYYYGHVGGQPYQIEIVDGDFLDLRDDLAAGAIGKTSSNPKGTPNPDDVPSSSDWQPLIENILAGAPLHTSLRGLAAKMVRSGMSKGAVVNFLRSLMEKSQARIDDQVRWMERVKSIPGLVDSAEKFRSDTPDDPALVPTGDAKLDAMNAKYAVVKEGGKVWVITFEQQRGRLVTVFISFKDFEHLLMNKFVAKEVVTEQGTTTKYIPLGKWWLSHSKRRQYEGLTFQPADNRRVIDGFFNLWRGFAYEPKQGDWSVLREHIRLVLASGDETAFDYIMRWLAWLVQHPDQRAEVCLVLRGKQGTGKGTLGKILVRLFGQHAAHISDAHHLVGHFNAHLRDCCFLFADEALWPGDRSAEGTLKRLITESTLWVEAKGRNGIEVDNYLHILMASNSDWIVPAGESERRYYMRDVSECHIQDHAWFAAIKKQMDSGGYEAMLFDLLNFDLGDFHPRHLPKDRGLISQQARSLQPLDSWWVELLESGTLTGSNSRNTTPNAAVSNRYETWVDIDGKKQRVTRLGLYDQARQIEPRLRSHTSDHQLGAYLRNQGCSNEKKVARRRGWTFPPLQACRQAWEKRFPGWQWRDAKTTEWRFETEDD